MKGLKVVYAIIILILLTVTLLYYFRFRWVTYKNPSLGFSISHPITWKHSIATDPDDTIHEDWIIESSKINEHSGKPVSTSVGLLIYAPSNETWTKYYNEQIAKMTLTVPELVHRSHTEVAGKDVEEMVAPGAIWIKPFEHKGKIYYFSGYNDETVKKIISTFKFIE